MSGSRDPYTQTRSGMSEVFQRSDEGNQNNLNLDGAAEAASNFEDIRKQILKKCSTIDAVMKEFGKIIPG